jgi:hypothetical protein
MKEYCEFYPKKEEDTCICAAGSDISGTTKDDLICNKEYSLTCQWANERRCQNANKSTNT